MKVQFKSDFYRSISFYITLALIVWCVYDLVKDNSVGEFIFDGIFLIVITVTLLFDLFKVQRK